MKKSAVLLIGILLASAAFVSPAAAQQYSIQQYLNIRSAAAPAFSPDGKRLAYLSNPTGTMQVWLTDLAGGKPRQLTNYDDNIGFVRWLTDDSLIFGKAKGGDENTQFFWMKADGSGVKPLTTDAGVRNNFGRVSYDGKTIYYASNKRSRQFFDIYKMDVATGKDELIYRQDGSNSFRAVTGSGSKFIVSRDGGELSLDNNLYLIDTEKTGETLLTPHSGAAEFGNPFFTADGIVFTHNDGREFTGLAQMRKKNAAGEDWSDANREVRIVDDAKWDVTDVEMAYYGNVMAYTVNREGFSDLYLRRYETGGKPLITTIARHAEKVALPVNGIVGGLDFDRGETKLAFAFNSPDQNSDIWIYDLKTNDLKQITRSDTAGIDSKTFVTPELIKYRSFDGREIPAWYYPPQGVVYLRLKDQPYRLFSFSKVVGAAGAQRLSSFKIPVIVSVHGGPEGQERPGFNPLYQYYLSRGYAILATNVRGSTGYGKTFTHLDDVKKREDSVKDLAFAVEWLKTKGGADPKKIAVMGGSYGGYMTLAAITLYPDLWAAAVDTVGISNWESFLKNTSGYRRRQREVEYGRLDRDIDFLRSISPIGKVDRIKCPLFVIQGKNDPRVPYTESEQIVDAVKKRGGIVQYKLFDDEGHGVSKLKNRLVLYPLVADFLDANLK